MFLTRMSPGSYESVIFSDGKPAEAKEGAADGCGMAITRLDRPDRTWNRLSTELMLTLRAIGDVEPLSFLFFSYYANNFCFRKPHIVDHVARKMEYMKKTLFGRIQDCARFKTQTMLSNCRIRDNLTISDRRAITDLRQSSD